MTRAVFDANVLVAAALSPGGVCAACMRAREEGRVELVASPRLIDEVRDVLSRPKFAAAISPERRELFVDALGRDCVIVEDVEEPDAVSRDPKDDYLVAAARRGNAQVIVTGDAHLLELDLTGLAVVSPREFLERLPA